MSTPDSSGDDVRLALLLKPEARSERGRESAARAAMALGLVETGRGTATISFRLDRTRFAQVFEASTHAQPGELDELGAMARSSDALDVDPVVPEALADFVEAVSVEPPAVLMADEVMR